MIANNTLGGKEPFAALCIEVRCADEADFDFACRTGCLRHIADLF